MVHGLLEVDVTVRLNEPIEERVSEDEAEDDLDLKEESKISEFEALGFCDSRCYCKLVLSSKGCGLSRRCA